MVNAAPGLVMLDWVALGLAALPLALTLVNLPFYRAPAPAPGHPALSVLIPARNEAHNIAAACSAVLASRGVAIELIVLDDHSTDATAAIARGLGDPRLRVEPAPPLPPGWSGKQHACARLAALASHELMVFLDADVRLAPDALSRIAGFMQRHEVGLASGFPFEMTQSWAERLLLPLIQFLLLGYLPMPLARIFPAPALGAGCGQLMVARRTAYRQVGGHAVIRRSLHDGLTLPRAFRAAGIMTGLFDASRFATCRMYDGAAEVWAGLGKNATEGMARPVALPVWSVLLAGGHVLPWLLLIVRPGGGVALACACGVGLRLLLAWRFRPRGAPVRFVSALLHPCGVLGLLAIQWAALLRAARGRPAVWRGRAYPAP